MARKLREAMTEKEQKLIDYMEPIVKAEVDKLDPIGLLALDCPKDEYSREIREITLRIWMANGHFLYLAEVMYIVFAYKFDLADAKPEGKYFAAAKNVMDKYQEWLRNGRS